MRLHSRTHPISVRGWCIRVGGRGEERGVLGLFLYVVLCAVEEYSVPSTPPGEAEKPIVSTAAQMHRQPRIAARPSKKICVCALWLARVF